MKLSRPLNKEQWRLQLVQNAAFAALEGSKRTALRSYLSGQGRKVIYVYDTDIIVTNCAPWSQGPVVHETERWVGGYGQVLPLRPTYDLELQERLGISREEDRQAEAVAQLIAKHALKARLDDSSTHPIYQLPAHFRETSKVYDAVRRRAEAFDRNDGNAIIRRSVAAVSGALVVLRDMATNTPGGIRDQRRISDFTFSIVKRILEKTRNPVKAVREWDRFYALNVNNGGIFSTEDFRWRGAESTRASRSGNDIVADCFTREPSKIEEGQKRALTDAAKRMIAVQKGRSAANSARVADDADAIADLFLINKRLKEAKTECRLVLVTGDRNISQLFFGEFHAAKNIDQDLATNFGRDCIHHHWSFIDEMAVAVNGQLHRTDLGEATGDDHASNDRPPDFFSGLLAFRDDPILEPGKGNWEAESLRKKQNIFYEICTKTEQSKYSEFISGVDELAISSAYKVWAEFTDRAVIAAELDAYSEPAFGDMQVLRERVVKVIQNSVRSEEINWERLQDEVTEEVIRARDRSNVVFSDIGADVLMAARENGVRNPPDLMLDRLHNTNVIFDNLASPENIYNTVERFNVDFDRIAADCHDSKDDGDDRQEVYLKYLVLGALVASAERWSVAEEHARNAITIIERSRRSKKPIPVREDIAEGEAESFLSGREAYFLRAIACRLLAHGERDLARAEIFLTTARERLVEDREKGSATVPFIRFDNEKLALALSGYYWKRMLDSDDFCDEAVDGIYVAVRGLLEERSRLISRSADRISPVGDKYESIKPITLVSIATNLIQVKAIWSFRAANEKVDAECPVSLALLRTALEDIYRNSNIVERLRQLDPSRSPDYQPKDAYRPLSICTPLILRYAAVGALLLRDDHAGYWRPTNIEEVDSLFRNHQNSTRYDTWRYPRLQEFARQLVRARSGSR
ncbi:hypothetical protein [Bradyrhizobium elkanii]|uniref:hypothetical protein n=1 Tax=Bradyrhizobium elkanii TaxID=29448 RepID=UPI0004AC709C|nr:hypothetical protein [Bradyrhizobium elkanii]